ncbi:MAG: amino acid permease [Planctomycetes bacterium]|nr:amino acid permease [Planctomycetota bacterium]
MAKGLGPWTAGALVVANMIGVGVFTTSGFALADLHRPEPVLLAWVIGGVLALCGALSYAGLVHAIPESGGEYVFLSRSTHPLAGFLAGWVSLLAGFTAPTAVAALALQDYLGPLLPWRGDRPFLATAAILLAWLLHGVRRSTGVHLQNAAVLLKLIVLIALIAAGAVSLPAATTVGTTGEPVSLPAFAKTLVYVSFAYSGWNAAVYITGELREPRAHTVRALVFGCCAVAVVYVALNAVVLYAAPPAQLAGRANVAAVAACALGGERFGVVVSGVVALALWTSISSMVMAGPRVYARMAADGVMPASLARGGTTPSGAVALQASLAIAAVWSTGLQELLGYAGVTLGLSSAATVLGLVRLRRLQGAAAVPVWGYPIVPLAFVAMTLGASALMATNGGWEALWGGLTLAAGVPAYYVLRWSRASRAPRT